MRRLILSCAAALLVTAPAEAQFTASNIDTPPDGTFMVDDGTGGSFQVAGTISGGTGNADIRCYRFGGSVGVAAGVSTAGDDFDTAVPFSAFTLDPPRCVLRAVNAGDIPSAPPGTPSVFAGPGLALTRLHPTRVSAGPNAGKLGEVDSYPELADTAFEVYSLGGCGASQAKLVDPATFETFDSPAACMPYLWHTDSQFTGPGTRSELQVDGQNHYLPSHTLTNELFTGSDQVAGAPELQFDYTQADDGSSAEIDEVVPPVRCATNTFPPTSGSCGSYLPGFVDATRTTRFEDGGRRWTVVDRYTSADGQAHQLDALYDHSFNGDGLPVFRFADETAFAERSAPFSRSLPAGPFSLIARASGASDADDGHTKIAQTWSAGAESFTVYEDSDDVHIRVRGTVPASGGFTFTWSFMIGETTGEVAAFAASERDRLGTPQVAITDPADGSTVTAPQVTVGGTASDAGGPAPSSVTVAGRAVSVGADGRWSAVVPLQLGDNRIEARVEDGFGNAATAARTVRRVSPPPFSPFLPAPPRDVRAPVVTASLSSTRFTVGPDATAITAQAGRRRGGTTVRWSVDEPGTTAFAIARTLPGRRSGRRCVRPTRRLVRRRARRCTRVVARGTLRRRTAAGRRQLRFSGRIGRRALPAGRYRMVVVATDLAGNRSRPRTLSFTVLRSRRR